ncbi:MAG TPA: carboxypeptidase regulatory-like domain-containing protein [Vicinamibacteria bacterium]|nr:carboxypeptidase regulatory-like domain-containing protein [Vicinamibacteria bacterium]
MVLRRLLACGLLGLAPSGEALAATLRGRVEVRLEPRAPLVRPAPQALATATARETPDRRRSVVYLERAPQGAFEEPERGRAVLDQRGEAFLPYVLSIGVGTTVEFTNSDSTFHNVFSLSKPRRFDLGRYARGQSKSVRFDRPGVVRVFCDIHSHMSAFILVFAHRFFAATDEAGGYRIEGLPPGAYSVAVWTDGQVRETRPVRIGEDAETVTADFVVE